ncbi:transposase [Eoetvoesiella caeni]|uniref:Transposase-like zinc ribbon protein n=2 Tax=Eoetvoesiella caeni TaxID=645616 RepID=A0A366H1T0_9BURK|nr:transposase-like zinc ribbon protein [Eoetvoesiella caeni]
MPAGAQLGLPPSTMSTPRIAKPRAHTPPLPGMCAEDKALQTLERYRWPNRNDVQCPRCNNKRLYQERRRGKPGFYRCPAVHRYEGQGISGGPYVFNVRSGTFLEHSGVPLSKWLYCLANLPDFSNRIPATQLAKAIHVTRRTATRMINLIALLDEWAWCKREGIEMPHDSITDDEATIDKFSESTAHIEFLWEYRLEQVRLAKSS